MIRTPELGLAQILQFDSEQGISKQESRGESHFTNCSWPQ